MEFAVLVSIPFLLAAFLVLPVFDSPTLKHGRSWFAAGVMALLCAAIVGYFPYVQEAAAMHTAVTTSIEWLPELGLTLSFYLDGLAFLFALVITGIGAGIFLYAGYYFDDAEEQRRFLLWLAAFAGAMLGVVLAGNLITLFIFWELTSVTSYMLIGFKGAQSEEARYGARQAFLITGGGGLALLAGLLLLGAAAGQVSGTNAPIYELAQIVKLDLSQHPYYSFIALFVLIGAFTKSAQFPFHFWLPGAMFAPTPASAYLHSATMVKAGIYLLARLYPTLHANPIWLQALTGLGLLTMFIGAFFALSQRDLKALLAYSTVSTLGAIVALLGLPDNAGITAAYMTILAHALYKAALFLAVGTVDHNTGTRLLDELGGLRKHMPVMAAIVVISALSMAGVPVFFGFVAKEALLDAFLHGTFSGQVAALSVVAVSAALTLVAAGIVAWEVFFKAPTHDIHFHASSPVLNVTPGLLAIGSAIMGLLLTPLVAPLLETATHNPVHLYLLPAAPLSNPAFLMSMGILLAGGALFYTRTKWRALTALPLPKGTDIYQAVFTGIDRLGTLVLKAQVGQVRYYLIVILGVVAYVLLSSGLVSDLLGSQTLQFDTSEITGETALRAILLALSVVAALATVLARVHITAALALGVVGYAVGGIFLLERAPDVALVQFIIETLTTILLILMLGRISQKMRREAMAKLWQGRSYFDDKNLGILRDIVIASAVGLAVFVFTLTALVNRPDSQTMADPAFCDFASAEVNNLPHTARQSIVRYHLCHAYQDVDSTDVVGAIVSDYRGMDTYIEITVFSVAALGVLTLLSRGLPVTSPFMPKPNIAATQGEYDSDALEDVKDATSLNTPFTRWVARIVLPLTFLVALSHLLYGGGAPGDGFTAGALLGLVTALWYVIFGHAETRERLPMLKPYHLLRAGLGLEMLNALLPMLLSGNFMKYVDYGKLLHIDEFLLQFGLHLSSTLLFEIGVCLTVFGVITTIMEIIAHPTSSADMGAE